VGDGEGQAEPEGFQDLHLTEMASWRERDRNIVKKPYYLILILIYVYILF